MYVYKICFKSRKQNSHSNELEVEHISKVHKSWPKLLACCLFKFVSFPPIKYSHIENHLNEGYFMNGNVKNGAF